MKDLFGTIKMHEIYKYIGAYTEHQFGGDMIDVRKCRLKMDTFVAFHLIFIKIASFMAFDFISFASE